MTIKELIPMVDATFRTIPDREHRAMAGLSMGSVQTLYIGLTNLDTFCLPRHLQPAPHVR